MTSSWGSPAWSPGWSPPSSSSAMRSGHFASGATSPRTPWQSGWDRANRASPSSRTGPRALPSTSTSERSSPCTLRRGEPRKARQAVGRGHSACLETNDSTNWGRLETQRAATAWMTQPGNAVFCGGAPEAGRPDFRWLRSLLPQQYAASTCHRGKSSLGDPAAAALLPGNLDLPLGLQFSKQPVNRIPASPR